MIARTVSRLVTWLQTRLPYPIVDGYIPDQIGRYRLIEVLLVLADGGR